MNTYIGKINLFLMLLLFTRILSASEAVVYGEYIPPKSPLVSLYKSKEKNLSIEEIKSKSKLFKTIDENTSYFGDEVTFWIKLELPKDLESGVYFTQVHPFTFNKNSLKKEQLDFNKTKYRLGHQLPFSLSFKYDAEKDDRIYFFQVEKIDVQAPFLFMQKLTIFDELQRVVEQREEYYSFTKERYEKALLSAIVIGLILMSALYSMVIYSYTRKKEFISYSLMQVAMTLFLLTAPFFHGIFSLEFLGMKELSLLVAFFATLFSKYFLETKEHLPKIDMLLNLYLVLIILDALWVKQAMLFDYKLYEVFGLLYLLTAILRIKKGFTPAWFYLLGWTGLLGAIFLGDYFHIGSYFIMFVGVAIEAIMLAWALVYKMRGLERD